MNQNKEIYECVIVGGGSAGLSAALVLGRSRRRVLVCDKGNPRNAPAHESHSFFTSDGISPHELLSIGRDQLKPYKSVEFQAIGVKEINPSADRKTLLENHNIPVREEKIIRLEGDNGQLENIVFETNEKIAHRGILIRPKQTLRSNLAEKLGCELNEFNSIETTNFFNETSIKGVYAAGDITSPMQTISAAVFQGSVAAGGLNQALIMEDFV